MAEQENAKQAIAQQRVRVLVDCHTFDGEYQGTRTFIREVYSRLALMPGINFYFAAHDVSKLQQVFSGPNVYFIRYKSRSSIRRLLFELPALIRAYHIDIAHFQYITPLMKNCRFIVTVHDVLFLDYPGEFSAWYRWYKKFLYRLGARRADVLTVNSEDTRKAVARYLDAGGKPVYLTPMAASPVFFEQYDKAEARAQFAEQYGFSRFILCVSRLEPRKNHVSLLRAWLDLALYQQGIHLVLVGHRSIDIPEFDSLLAQQPDEIRAFILINDSIDPGELLLFYRAASVFVYLSKAEGFGIPPLEAAAAGVPVICSNTSAMAEYDFFGKGHVDPNDYTAFRSVLKEMLDHPAGETLLRSISSTVKDRYSWDRSVNVFQKFFTAYSEGNR